MSRISVNFIGGIWIFFKSDGLWNCLADLSITFKGSYVLKVQMISECIYEIIDFPKYHRKHLIDFCPESLFRLGMLCTHLSRVALRIIKTNHMYLVYKTFQGRNLSNFLVVFWKIDDFIDTFWHYLTFKKLVWGGISKQMWHITLTYLISAHICAVIHSSTYM